MKNQLQDCDDNNNPSPKKMRTETSQPGDTAAATAATAAKDSDSSDSKGTLYITIGPQCAGKTTGLKQIFGIPTSSCNNKHEEEKVGKEEEDDRMANVANGSGVDITIDDQALVYIPVPNNYFLHSVSTSTTNPSTNTGSVVTTGGTTPSIPSSSSSSSSQPSMMLDETIMGKTIRERIADPSNKEMVLVLQRLGGIIDAKEFQSRLLQAGGNNKNNNNNNNNNNYNKNGVVVAAAGETSKTTAKEDLIQVVEELINRSNAEDSSVDDNNGQGNVNSDRMSLLPEKIDLFIVESIFRPRPLSSPLQNIRSSSSTTTTTTTTTTSSALDEAHRLLASHASDPRIHPPASPLAWGNTNTRPREYEKALHAAATSGRPVEFIVYGGREVCEAMTVTMTMTMTMTMMGGSSSKSNGKGSKSNGEHREKSEKMDGRAKEEVAVEGINGEIDAVNDSVDEDRNRRDLLSCLPKVDRRTLLLRNLRRLLATGRYVPCGAVDDAMGRVESLLASASSSSSSEYQKETKGREEKEEEKEAGSKIRNMTNAKFRLDFELARMAGYRMNDDRTVRAMPNGSSSNGGNNNNNNGRNGNHRNNHNSNRNHNGRNDNRRNGRGDDHRRRRRERHDPPSDGSYGGRGGREHGVGGRVGYGGRSSYNSRPHNNNDDRNRGRGQEREYDDRGGGYDDRGRHSRGEGGGNYHSGGRGRDDDSHRSSGGRGGWNRSGGRGQGR